MIPAVFLWALSVGLHAADIRGAGGMVVNKDTFVFAAISDVAGLDPVVPYDAVSQGLIFNVYETLLAFEGETNDRLIGRLAEKVPTSKNGLISADGRTYTFPIRRQVRFHDGTIMIAEDVRYSLLRFMLTDPAGGPASLLLEPILGKSSTRDAKGNLVVTYEEAARAVRLEGGNVVVTLKEPFAPFLSIMARWSYVMSRNWSRKNGDWDGDGSTWKQFNNPDKDRTAYYDKMNGTGPFRLERWDRQGHKIFLGRFDGYWGKKPRLARVILAAVPEFSTRKLMLQAGDADLIEVPRPFVSQVAGLPGVRIADGLPRLMTDPALFFTFRINPVANPDIGSGKLDGNGIPPDFFADSNVRKGFAYSFDYDAFLKDTFKGTAKRATGVIPPGLVGHDPKAEGYKLDSMRAADHFKKAWRGEAWKKGFKLTITYSKGSENRETACQILKKNVEALNPKFRVDLRGVEWPTFLDRTQRRLMPLWSRGWTADYPDPHNFVFPFYHSNGRYATAQGYSDSNMDAMVEQAVREIDPVKRERLYWKIQDYAREEVPGLTTVHPTGVYAMRDWVKGFYDNAVFMGIYFHPLSKG